jgi:two-component system response regulator PilR (NtrC family)
MTKALALLVDDEADILDLLKITLGRMGIQAVTATNLGEAKAQLERQPLDLCLTDMNLPDGNGIDLVRHIAERHPDLPVAMITAHGSMDSAVAAMKAGAFDFVSKPVDLKLLRQLVESALRLRSRGSARPEPGEAGTRLLGDSPKMEEIRRLIAKLARNQAPVFITGESGTGKELAARLIHAEGPRRERPFVAVNCGAIPQELVESELFGHRKGSFTGALSDKEGLFQAAQGGTLFLDEVADLPLPAQVKLLRAIQEKSVRAVGAQHEVPVDVRIISASHRDLTEEVDAGRFRQDLFYRINVIELRMPALRERPQDIPDLAERMLERIAQRHGTGNAMTLSASAVEALKQHPFPGNVRELENILERATALCEGPVIEAGDLHLPKGEGPAVPNCANADSGVALESYLGEIERQAILKALDETRWNRTAAARKLGMTLRSLRYRLAKLGIE